ncbi:hypothetical protein A3G62_01960 [Candidatus Kaiserbacteria bacterium RIFCSPLOWO2_12_FULL_50_10]|nr:MAG: hypothetical protein A3G62_01960 [Candidatus Kaiserbacteria bacterium RIFCSPLOWO2_12_FULL_50_10]
MASKTAIEANEDMMRDAHTYEFAFHILPTVAGTEVADVVKGLTDLLEKEGATITDSEFPERIELAYEIDKVIDGAHKRFHSAYFGWVRMTIQAEGLTRFQEELTHNANVLRSLIVKLSQEEIENPFKYHAQPRKEAKASDADADVAEATEAPAAEIAEEATETTTA